MSFVYSHPFTGLANGLNTINAAAGAIGGWVELGRTTLGATSTTIDVSSLADKRYYMFLMDYDLNNSISQDNTLRLGNSSVDTGSNYSMRDSSNGGTDATNTSTDYIRGDGAVGAATGDQGFRVGYIANRSASEKLVIHHNVTRSGSGAGNAPDRYEVTGKWANTSNPLDVIRLGYGGNTYETNSEVVVLGWDPDDTHTNNFWQELGEFTGSSPSGSITAKKYLWVQAWIKGTGNAGFRVGNSTLDSGTNYAIRYQSNGGTDSTTTSNSNTESLTVTTPIFYNMFIVNNASNEKLAIAHMARQNTAGATTAPNRFEEVWKWDNTSNQIDILGFVALSGALDSGCIVKVWGAD